MAGVELSKIAKTRLCTVRDRLEAKTHYWKSKKLTTGSSKTHY